MTVDPKRRPRERARFSFDLSAEGAGAVELPRPIRPDPPGRTLERSGIPGDPVAAGRASLSEGDSDRDSDDLPPLDFPLDLSEETRRKPTGRTATGPRANESLGPGASEPEAPHSGRDAAWLAPIRQQFREARLRVEQGSRAARSERDEGAQRLDPPGKPSAPAWGEPLEAKAPGARARGSAGQRASTPPGASKSRSARAFLGPVLMVAVAAGAYVAATTSYGLLAPSLSRRAPRVPDLGSLESKERSSGSLQASKKSGPDGAASSSGAPKAPAEPIVETGPMPSGVSYPGRGLLEVVTSERELVYVDGIFVGRGPLRRIPLQPGQHGILIRSGGNERKAQALVSVGASTQVHFEVDRAAADAASPAADGDAANEVGADAEELE